MKCAAVGIRRASPSQCPPRGERPRPAPWTGGAPPKRHTRTARPTRTRTPLPEAGPPVIDPAAAAVTRARTLPAAAALEPAEERGQAAAPRAVPKAGVRGEERYASA